MLTPMIQDKPGTPITDDNAKRWNVEMMGAPIVGIPAGPVRDCHFAISWQQRDPHSDTGRYRAAGIHDAGVFVVYAARPVRAALKVRGVAPVAPDVYATADTIEAAIAAAHRLFERAGA